MPTTGVRQANVKRGAWQVLKKGEKGGKASQVSGSIARHRPSGQPQNTSTMHAQVHITKA
eukprot:3840098-Amphidinium_carterae.2